MSMTKTIFEAMGRIATDSRGRAVTTTLTFVWTPAGQKIVVNGEMNFRQEISAAVLDILLDAPDVTKLSFAGEPV